MSSSPTWPDLLTTLLEGEDLSISESAWAMQQVMDGKASEAQLSAFLVALRAKGETVNELVGFRDAIMHSALPLAVDPMAVDIVGTGGDRHGTVNVSTMASVVAAAAGARVIKHGNRAASSASGASDVLAALGIDLTLDPKRVAEILDEAGITFAYAALFHPGFKHAGAVRKELGIPTIFNYLGPLVNPARAEASAVGVASAAMLPLIAGVFQTRGATALVFRGDDGLDELTTTGHSQLVEVSRGMLTEHDIDPADFGMPRAELSDLIGGTPEYNAEVARRTLAGEQGPVRDIVLLNAAAGLVAWDLARDHEQSQRPIRERFAERIADAASTIDSGAATAKLREWASATQR
ncbi:anthranilate phosphoribosyltransferase [Ruicaihuangia caeni]|uniref:Anthranilate phosphoribosyltransferase n=1 Tax=Ruicaihuangia caeni TaxID=3042517 RepID=A0AAW6T6B2_9MICO|nr:anthranilate phosphoribosyltransferase [Klugiella sp. YN-L-19]MDI2098216.1 anthranilate phosphoribosyltransferase [Klugiella sp. YN-L-19]